MEEDILGETFGGNKAETAIANQSLDCSCHVKLSLIINVSSFSNFDYVSYDFLFILLYHIGFILSSTIVAHKAVFCRAPEDCLVWWGPLCAMISPMFTKAEMAKLKRLNTPAKVQDFINAIPINFEENGKDTVKSPLHVIRTNSAHCIEGAILGAYVLSLHGHKPFLMHLDTDRDWNHVIAPFKIGEYWGALSKTNHADLRYRDPVYKTLRELVMSYFPEYTTDSGRKTLRSYSRPLNLNGFEKGWECAEDNLWGIDEELENIKHYEIAPKSIIQNLRRADRLECEAGKLTEWKPK